MYRDKTFGSSAADSSAASVGVLDISLTFLKACLSGKCKANSCQISSGCVPMTGGLISVGDFKQYLTPDYAKVVTSVMRL